jgi:hypothetical protein
MKKKVEITDSLLKIRTKKSAGAPIFLQIKTLFFFFR